MDIHAACVSGIMEVSLITKVESLVQVGVVKSPESARELADALNRWADWKEKSMSEWPWDQTKVDFNKWNKSEWPWYKTLWMWVCEVTGMEYKL